MKRIYQLAAFFLLVSSNVFAQYSTDWIRPADTYQKIGVMIATDNQDNVIATGYWTSYNMFTRKYNKFGVLQWEAVSASGIPSNYEKPLWVTTDNNDNVFVAGYRYAGTGSTGSPLAIIIVKYDPQGNELWKKVVSPVNYLAGMSLRCEVDVNGNLYVGACGVGILPGFALIKLDPAGNILFTQNSDVNAPKYFSSMRLKGSKIVLTSSSGNLSLAPVAVWDTTGVLLWTAGLLGRGGADVEIDDAGNVYLLTGYVNQVSPTSQMDVEMYKFDPSGTQLWKKDFDFGGSEFSTRFTYAGNKLSIIAYGSIAASYFDWITFQVDTDGNMNWNTRYNETSGNDEQPYFISAKANGEVFVTGKGGPMYTYLGSQYLRMITVKYDNTGLRKWVDSVNIYSGWGLACKLASDNSLYVLSGTSMTVFHFLDHNGTAPPTIPAGLSVGNITDTSATFSWAPVGGALLYHLRYKINGTSTWTTASIDVPAINITGLAASTLYDYACEAVGSGGPSGYGATQNFSTSGPVLAIHGVDIKAKRQGANVLVSWSTQSEQNSAYFEVERSYNGIDFIKVVQVQAAGNSSNLRYYQYTDLNAAKSMVFYRLKMVDADASYRLSPVRVVPKLDGNSKELLLYPNPARSYTNIVLNEAVTENLQIQITNQMGQLVSAIRVSKGTQLLKLDISALPKGIYFVSLVGRDKAVVNKLFIR